MREKVMIEYAKKTKACPECDNNILLSATRCRCGWGAKTEKSKPVYFCCAFENNTRCNVRHELKRINPHDADRPAFFCAKHWEEKIGMPTHLARMREYENAIRERNAQESVKGSVKASMNNNFPGYLELYGKN